MNVCGKDILVGGRLVRIARLDGEKYVFPDNLDALLASLRNCGTRIDLFTFVQRPPDTSPKYPYAMERDNLAVLPISTFEHWWSKQIRSVPRNRARQAEKKGVVIREVPFGPVLLQGICEIHNESPVRQGRRFPHYGMDLEGARRYAGTFLDRSTFIGAFLGDSMIGFIKLVEDDSKTYACSVNILSKLEQRDKAPTNALLAHAVKLCAERHYKYLVYEHFAYGKKPADSLSKFKEINGFQRMDLPRYYIPLTATGKLALRLGLHRRVVDYCPEALMAKLRDLRTAWYTGKLRPSPDAS
jgi:hypothetical protein